jgi:hypothetical protein
MGIGRKQGFRPSCMASKNSRLPGSRREGALAAVAADRAYQTASYTDALPHFKRAAGLGLMSGALAVANHLNRRSPVGDLSHQLGREHTSLVLVPSAMVAGVAALAEVQRGVEQMRAA